MITEDLSPFTIGPNETVYEALVKIEENNRGTVIVTQNDHVIGVLTDGDIRKILIKHRMLTIPVREVMNQHFIYLNEPSADEAEKIYKKSFFVRLIPIVNSDGMLQGIHLRD